MNLLGTFHVLDASLELAFELRPDLALVVAAAPSSFGPQEHRSQPSKDTRRGPKVARASTTPGRYPSRLPASPDIPDVVTGNLGWSAPLSDSLLVAFSVFLV